MDFASPLSVEAVSHREAKMFAYRSFTAVLGSALTLACFDAGAVVINFDDVADGTIIDITYVGLGVTFNNPLGVSADNPDSPNIYARTSSTNASSPNVVSVFATGFPAFDARWGAVEAVFLTGQDSVSIDAAIFRLPEGLGTPQNFPKLEIFNLSGMFVTSVNWDFSETPQPGAGGISAFQTLDYTSPGLNDVGKVRFLSGQPGGNPSNFGIFDNLVFNVAQVVPEPGTVALIALALLGLPLTRVRRQRRSKG
jgi:hypothetical protein